MFIDIPAILPIQGKVWGTTQCIFRNETVEVCSIYTKKGGYCSEHFHKFKHNRFFVFSGKMSVKIFRDQENSHLIDETILESGDATDVGPNAWHIFECLEDCHALEIYWVSLNSEDIVRRTEGGMR